MSSSLEVKKSSLGLDAQMIASSVRSLDANYYQVSSSAQSAAINMNGTAKRILPGPTEKRAQYLLRDVSSVTLLSHIPFPERTDAASLAYRRGVP